MTPTTFKCRQCGHLFISIEGDLIAPSFQAKKPCPKCGSSCYPSGISSIFAKITGKH